MKGKRGKMSLEQYSKATRETAENLRIIDDALFRLMAERRCMSRNSSYFVGYAKSGRCKCKLSICS